MASQKVARSAAALTGKCPFLHTIKANGAAASAVTGHVPELAAQCPHMVRTHESPYLHLADMATANRGPDSASVQCSACGVQVSSSSSCGQKSQADVPPACSPRPAQNSSQMSPNWYRSKFENIVNTIKEEGRYRVFLEQSRQAGNFPHTTATPDASDASQLVSWCSNDYLGMGQNPKVLQAMHTALDANGAGAGGTRNISGTNVHHVRLERTLAALHQQEASLVFSSCYVANETVLATLGKLFPDLVIFSDEFNHASMIHGVRNARVKKVVYRHNDMDDLRAKLAAADPSVPKLVAFESVNSMEGTVAPMHELCDLADQYGAMTFCDEVHAVGLYGDHGGGISERDGVAARLTMVTGTLGKAYGVVGGYLSASAPLIDAMRSIAPGFIFTTSVPPVVAAGANTAVQHLMFSRWERRIMHAKAHRLKELLAEAGFPLLPSVSHIVPVLVGDAAAAKATADALRQEHGIYAQPINYPTVPRGTERLRFTVTPFHTMPMIRELVRSLTRVWREVGLPLRSPAEGAPLPVVLHANEDSVPTAVQEHMEMQGQGHIVQQWAQPETLHATEQEVEAAGEMVSYGVWGGGQLEGATPLDAGMQDMLAQAAAEKLAGGSSDVDAWLRSLHDDALDQVAGVTLPVLGKATVGMSPRDHSPAKSMVADMEQRM